MILIDYRKFLSMRFDLVIRYHLLEEASFDFKKAKRLITEDNRYAFLREAYGILGLPVTAKMKTGRLYEKFGDNLSLFMAHGLFFIKNYIWIEKALHKEEQWFQANPYGLNRNEDGIPTKRFLVALKLDKPMWWCRGGYLSCYKVNPRSIRIKEEYRAALSPKQFRLFELAEERLIKHMRKLKFFSTATELEAPLFDYNKFLSNRYDFVIRFKLLEQMGFDVRKAKQLWEVKRAKGKPVIIPRASDQYNFLDRFLVGAEFFTSLNNWNYVDKQVRENIDWLREKPYLVTTDCIGTSIKRFFAALKHEKPLYWGMVDTYDKKYSDKLLETTWSEDLYKKNLTAMELEPFNRAKTRLMAKMFKLRFFCESTKLENCKEIAE